MYYSVTRTDELYHYGIKGMKWGVRRYQNPDGTYTSAGKRRRRADYISEAKGMSDEDLKKASKRLNLEKQYREEATKNSKTAYDEAAEKFWKNTSAISLKANQAAKNKYGKKSPEKKTVSKISKGVEASSRLSSKLHAKKEIINADLSSVSDSELRARVKRLRSENEYADLKYASQKSGLKRTKDILDTAGDILAIGATAVTVYKAAPKVLNKVLSKYGGLKI